MKLLLLGLLFGLALAYPGKRQNGNKDVDENCYHANTEYKYHYDTQVLTGIPNAGQLHSGFRLACMARVQFSTLSQVRVQLDSMVVYRVNEPIEWKASERLVQEWLLKELVGEEADSFIDFLKIPFEFEYANGMVLKVILDDRETTWSANIKRGFISLFEMNLEKRLMMQESLPASQSPLPPNVEWYNALERTPVGDCVTLYTVTPTAKSDNLYVTKTRDYLRCLNNTVYTSTMMGGEYIEGSAQENQISHGATLQYSVRKSNEEFIILSAIGESQLVFSPYKNNQYMKTSVNQTMTLRSSKYIVEGMTVIPEIQQGQHKRDSIIMTLPASPVDCKDPFTPCQQEPKQVTEPADVYTVEKIYLHLRMAAENNYAISSQESLVHVRLARDMLKQTPEVVLKALWDYLTIDKNDTMTDLIKKIYWEALTTTGTEDASGLVLDICLEDMPNNCTMALSSIVLRTSPTENIISKLINLIENSNLNKLERQAAYLSLGSFGFKLTQELQKQTKQCEQASQILKSVTIDDSKYGSLFLIRSKEELEQRCNQIPVIYSQIEEKILKVLIALAQSSLTEDKILAIKALGNSGLAGGLDTLTKFIENTEEEQMTRIMAVTGFRRIQYPEVQRQQAIQTLMKLYFTTSQSNELRSMAFVIMSGLRPDLPVYETIAQSLHHEKDYYVSSFVYSFLRTFSNSTFFPDQHLQKNCTSALKFAAEIPSRFDHSFTRRFSEFDADMKRGTGLSVSVLGDISRYLGSSLSLDTYFHGLYSPAFEVGVNTEGLNTFLNKLFGPKGLITRGKSVFDLLKRSQRDISPQQRIDQILKTLNVKSRTMLEPSGHIYFKMMGHEIHYLDLSSILEGISMMGKVAVDFNEEEMSVGVPVEINNIFGFFDERMTVATEAGFPITLQLNTHASVKLEGKVSFSVKPYVFESERDGELPMEINAGIDIKPRVSVETQLTMGLDLLFYKPVVGNRALVKFNSPVKEDIKFNIKDKLAVFNWYKTVDDKPAVQVLIEPFAEFAMNTKQNESPVFMSDRRSIYDPAGVRIFPVNYNQKLDILGYALKASGQLPFCFAKSFFKHNPMCLHSGRTLINFFWKPLENAPEVISFYAQSLQEEKPVVEPKQEDEGTKTYRDPVNIKNGALSKQEFCDKLEQVYGKPLPCMEPEYSRAYVLLLDASTSTVKRQAQIETLWTSFFNDQSGQLYTRLWRSAIPDVDPQEWSMLSEFGMTYPSEVMEPKDIFNPDWQSKLMDDLENLIAFDYQKIGNQGINMTMTSILEQLNYPAQIRAPTYNVLDALVPEELYTLLNESGSVINNRPWNQYWRYLGPTYRLLVQSERINVETSVMYQDTFLSESLNEVLKSQIKFMDELRKIIFEATIAHAELPILQWIDYIQLKSVYLIQDLFDKAVMKGNIQDPNPILENLKKARKNNDIILPLVTRLLDDTNGASVRSAETRRSQVQSNFEQEKEYAFNRPAYMRNLDKRVLQTNGWDPLKFMMYNLSVNQMHLIEKLHLYLTEDKQVDRNEVFTIISDTKYVIDLLDIDLKKGPISDPVARQTLLLITVQNELMIEILEQCKNVWKGKLNSNFVFNQNSRVGNDDFILTSLMIIKEQSVFLGERSAMLYRTNLMKKSVLIHLPMSQITTYENIGKAKTKMIPEVREFQIYVSFNYTNMKNPAVLTTYLDKYCQDITEHVTEIKGLQAALLNLGEAPKIYLVSELLDALYYLKFMTEFSRRTLTSIDQDFRFTYLERLSDLSAQVQNLIADMSPIFEIYSKPSSNAQTDLPFWNSLPIGPEILHLQDLIQQQTMIRTFLARFFGNGEVSRNEASRVMRIAVRKSTEIQQALRKYHDQDMSDKSPEEKKAITDLVNKALQKQSQLFEYIQRIIQIYRERIRDSESFSEQIGVVQQDVTEIKQTRNLIKDPYPGEKHSDIYSAQSDESNEANSPYENPISAMIANFNCTWGSEQAAEKSIQLQFRATRSIEQILSLYKQMSGLSRGEDVIRAINFRLSDEPWMSEKVMEDLNTFNHWHFVSQAKKEDLPQWFLDLQNYFKDLRKVSFWDSYKRQPAVSYLPDNQYHSLVDISAKNNEIDIYMMDHLETDVFQGIKPFKFFTEFPIIQTYKPAKEKVISYLTDDERPAKCYVNKDQVYSFDRVGYQLPASIFTRQQTLLVGDCSEEQTFAVTMVNCNTSCAGHSIQLINYDRLVEVKPSILDVEVKVDGTIIQLEDDKPVYYYKTVSYDITKVSCKIVRKGLTVTVEFPITGISFHIDGFYLETEISPLFKRSVCGLCSNFDGQRAWEYEGPTGEIYTSSSLFANSYIVGSNRMVFYPNNPKFHVQNDRYNDVVSHSRPKGSPGRYVEDDDDEDDDDQQRSGDKDSQEESEEDQCYIRPTTMKRTTTINQVKQKCFSLELVPRCLRICSFIKSKERREVPFVCAEAGSQTARQLEYMASRGPLKNVEQLGGERVLFSVRDVVQCSQPRQ